MGFIADKIDVKITNNLILEIKKSELTDILIEYFADSSFVGDHKHRLIVDGGLRSTTKQPSAKYSIIIFFGPNFFISSVRLFVILNIILDVVWLNTRFLVNF